LNSGDHSGAQNKKGVSGTFFATRIAPERYFFGVGDKNGEFSERAITLEFEKSIIVGIYAQNSGLENAPKTGMPKNLQKRRRWDSAFVAYVR